MFTRFAAIVNPLKTLGKGVDDEDQVNKILSSLKGTEWIQKRIGIEEGKAIDTLTYDELMEKIEGV